MELRNNLANLITILRFITSFFLIFTTTFSLEFFICYTIGGLSDIFDGIIARKLNCNSKFGDKLDSIADLIFAIVCLFKVILAIYIPIWVWIWIVVIFLIKMVNLVFAYSKYNELKFLHTKANKITGLLLFLLVFLLPFISISYCAIFICIVATFAAIQEGYLIKKG